MKARALAAWVGLVLWVAAPIGLAVWIVDTQRSAVTPSPQPTWSPVTAAEGAADVPVAILLEWRRPDPAPAPAWSGIVEEVLLEPGDRVGTGTPIARVGGIVRIASSVGTPIGRSLQRGDTGPDVASLNRTLATLGFPADDRDTFGADTLAGVRQLGEHLGAGRQSVFDPSWLVFLPGGDGVASEVHLGLGRPALGQGEGAVSLEPVLGRARVVAVDDVPSEDGAGPAPDGDAGAAPSDLDSVESSVVIEPGAVVVMDGAEVAVREDGEVETSSLAALAEHADEKAASLPATLRPPRSGDLLQVPTASVFAGPEGASCVRLRRGGPPEVVAVDVVDSYIGTTFVTGDVEDADVEVNPPTAVRSRCR